jgi:hypothetical protein
MRVGGVKSGFGNVKRGPTNICALLDFHILVFGMRNEVSEHMYLQISFCNWWLFNPDQKQIKNFKKENASNGIQKVILTFFFLMLLDLTDVCPLLTKQYIQVELQIQYMLYNFLDGLSPHI